MKDKLNARERRSLRTAVSNGNLDEWIRKHLGGEIEVENKTMYRIRVDNGFHCDVYTLFKETGEIVYECTCLKNAPLERLRQVIEETDSERMVKKVLLWHYKTTVGDLRVNHLRNEIKYEVFREVVRLNLNTGVLKVLKYT